jgi:nucleotide-binding universal stress UspA family protein
MSRQDLPIIVGTDGSTGATAAIDWAAREAGLRHCPLAIAHASAPDLVALRSGVAAVPPPSATGRPAYVEDAVLRVADEHPGLDVSALDLAGGASAALIGASRDATMLVVGARGRTRVAEVLLGSVSRHVSAHAHCPVAVVHELHDGSTWPVAVGIDGSTASQHALRLAATEASMRHVALLVVHAWRDEVYTGYGVYTTPVDLTRELQQAAEALASNEIAPLAEQFPDLEVIVRVTQSHPVTALVQASHEAQLMVVGAHGRGFFPGMGQGSVAGGVVHSASTPVIVVPVPSI